MLWKLIHKIFGCDYVHTAHYLHGGKIRRVRTAPNGTKLVKLRHGMKFCIMDPLPLTGETRGKWLVVPLTPGITEKSSATSN